jgi:hypothetical protein
MPEAVQFWLDNKMSAGLKVAAIGNQALVSYRDKYYIVEKDAAQMKGGKPLRYSMSSMPAIWKKALKGEVSPAEVLAVPADDALPAPTVTKREREKKLPVPPPHVPAGTLSAPAPLQASSNPAVITKKTDMKPLAQTSVTANCPQCNFRHEIPLEKGKNGKPFFMACTKCKADFAVRFVPAMIYQAQVAGFK